MQKPQTLIQFFSLLLLLFFLHRIVWCGTKKLPHFLTCLLPLLVSISGICFISAARRRRRRRRRRRQGQKTEESEREGQAGE
jgi:hypothetical protein